MDHHSWYISFFEALYAINFCVFSHIAAWSRMLCTIHNPHDFPGQSDMELSSCIMFCVVKDVTWCHCELSMIPPAFILLNFIAPITLGDWLPFWCFTRSCHWLNPTVSQPSLVFWLFRRKHVHSVSVRDDLYIRWYHIGFIIRQIGDSKATVATLKSSE